MQRASILALSLCGALSAQYVGEPPTNIVAPSNNPALGAAAWGATVTAVAQIQMVSYWANPTQFYVAATIVDSNVGTFYAPASAVWDPATNTLTVNSDAAGLNNPTTDTFAFTVSTDGRFAASDNGAGAQPFFIYRASASGPWASGLIGTISGVPSGYIDCMFGDVVGPDQVELIYINGLRIERTLLQVDLTTGNAAAIPGTTITVADRGTVQLHSPSPVRDASGRGKALIMSTVVSGSNGNYVERITDVNIHATPVREHIQNSGWTANPAAIGGQQYWAYATSGYIDPLDVKSVMLAGLVVQRGNPAVINAFAPPKAVPTDVMVLVIGRLGSAGIPLSIFGVTGNLGLDPLGPLVFLNMSPINPITGDSALPLGTIPAGTRPGSIDLQAVRFDPLAAPGSQLHMSNNAKLTITL